MIKILMSKFLAVIICIYLTPQQAFSQYFTGPISAGYGNAGRTGIESAETLFSNPATLIYTKDSNAAFFYHDGYTSDDKHDKLLGVSIADNHEGSYFPGAISYINRRRTLGAGLFGVSESLWQISVARALTQSIGFGASIYRLEQKLDHSPQKFTQWSGNLGLAYQASSQIRLALTHHNTHHDKDNNRPEYLDMIPVWGSGLHYQYNDFLSVRTELSYSTRQNPDDKFSYHAGLETKVFDFNSLRLGWNKDGRLDDDFFTLGWSFTGPRFHLNYTIQKNSGHSRGHLHLVGLSSAI